LTFTKNWSLASNCISGANDTSCDVQINITSTTLVIHTRAKQVHLRLTTKNFGSNLLDAVNLLSGKTHG